MKLKAQCIDGTLVDVKITDCPVRINKEFMVLANVPMSKLVYDCSLKRYDDNYTEYSYAFNEEYKLVGYVIYKAGWKLYDRNTGELGELKEGYSFTANQNIRLIANLQNYSDPITFMCGGNKYCIRSIVGRYGNKLMLYIGGNIEYIDIGSESEVTIQ